MVSLDDPKLGKALDEPELPRMTFGDHLEELRSRVVKSLLAIVVAVVALLPFKDSVEEVILGPYRAQWRAGFLAHIESLEAKVAAAATGAPLDKRTPGFLEYARANKDAILAGRDEYSFLLKEETGYPVPYGLYSINGLEDMLAFMWASLMFALVIASPIVIWQVWAFIAAGLYKAERAAFYRYFPLMACLLAGGVAFGYFIALPYSLGFLIRMMNPDQVNAMFSVGQYLTLLFALTGAMGLVFQLPVVMVALQRIGLVTHRAFVKNWRLTILIIFVVAAVVTPPEPISMLLMAAPMLLLYGLGLLLTWWARGRDAPVVAA
ncbi:MAG: twin-arginine translocase subunit TatC [Planctomycetota bacterium]